ncbi:VWFA domain-containing protein [Mycena venus]|uniref:VWFA domain-containing protein n=1 Tax=Mycena venus TaxID=2733690 RepID=A0A8H7D1W0_9AGAR|nr:VWFA domain-containing protein [Mycena venus]
MSDNVSEVVLAPDGAGNNIDGRNASKSSDEFADSNEIPFVEKVEIPSLHATVPDGPMGATVTPEPVVSTDLMHSVNGMFRVLDLLSEHGRSVFPFISDYWYRSEYFKSAMASVCGQCIALRLPSEHFTVNKIIISQDSLKAFINELSPGAYSSLTKVDFKTLDQLHIKPAGLYGSKSEIVAFLSALGAIDELTAHALCLSRDDAAGPSLRSGLYLLRSFGSEPGKEQIFVIYWPEDTTWDDNAISSISRNRETFMRYLTKMCDQVTCLISEEHARSIAWNDESEDAATNDENNKPSRLYKFTVAKTNEQEETVTPRPGFEIMTPVLAERRDEGGHSIDPADLQPKLVSGETGQALLTTVYTPAGLRESPLDGNYNALQLRDLMKGGVEFAPNLPDRAIEALLVKSPVGSQLQLQYTKAPDNWRARNAAKSKELGDKFKKQEADLDSEVIKQTEQRRDQFCQALIDGLVHRFPSIKLGSILNASEDERCDLRNQFSALIKIHPSIATELDALVESPHVGTITPDSFKRLKETLLHVEVFLGTTRQDLVGSQRETAIMEILNKKGFPPSLTNNDVKDSGKIFPSVRSFASAVVGSLFNWNSRDQVAYIESATRQLVATTSDAQFLAGLEDLVAMEPRVLGGIISQTIEIATAHLGHHVDKFVKILVGKAVQIQQEFRRGKLRQNVEKTRMESSRESRHILRAEMERKTPTASVFVTAFDVETPHSGSPSYNVEGFQRSNSPASLDCDIHLLSLTTDDRHSIQIDPLFVPSPRIMKSTAWFSLNPEERIVHAQLIESGDFLLVLEDPTNLYIYLEKLRTGFDIFRKHRKSINRGKIGEKSLIAYDESTRMLLICATSQLKFHLYVFDETYSGSLQGAGSVDLTESYAAGTTITHACFVVGKEEILVVDSGNMARIYSLQPRQFRPATVSLPQSPISAYSSPDGACLILSYPGDSGLAFHAYHWDTFGSEGINLGMLQVPCSALCLTSMVNRRNVHLVGIDTGVCGSVALDITKKATEFMFTETAGKSSLKARHNTITHNALINCHSDVWARFPVIAAVQRQTIISSKNRLPRSFTFSTNSDHSKFSPYFDDLICNFEQQTRKPTGNQLKKVEVHALDIDGVLSLFSTTQWPVSEFRAGEWLVDLLCLIPIQIAVTQENRFVPLKDGVVSAALEQKLLGAEVGSIVDALSLGWYESVFQSYMVSKPVKVVSSMGEQSVGKSFCLNHLVDTSFAGSAMRTTEGVWMSVTPTENALIVALDFEGVHSIERSAQEDTLLVLFNTAISNLVVFRNNFALSRSVTGLFQSFQSSSTVLDPAANPQLFKSTLVIVIKVDVVDADEKEIVKEFQTKFQKIVADEQSANFISRLHAGQLDIIPWPVIESKQFYALFPTLKKTLDQQEVTHPTAGEFLHTLKTLMAKLKANDWGALSETLAAHRAQKLCTYLDSALEFGFYEREPTIEPLKNFDTDAPIDQPDTSSRFFLSTSSATPEERQNIMATLQKSWDQFGARHQMSEAEWIAGLSLFLLERAEMRIKYVFHWIGSNLARFKSNHANMDLLRRDFDSGAVDLRSNVEICRMQCASCDLLCLLGRRHDTDAPHDCQTSHKCPHPCDFGDEHAEPENCGYPSGHTGKHICVVGVHLCGEPCMLEDKNGCMKKCTKVAKHSDGAHMCAARVHSCGQPCSLQHLKSTRGKPYTCPQTCAISSHEVHDHHVCNTPSCPMTCELCERLCANKDHLHGLQPDARHLCGQEHKCASHCQAKGICQIDTAPQSIEATFTGRHETFQYTKYSQDSKRLRCAIKIPPNERRHEGPHVHTEDPHPFHFCETRCLNCGYFCTLPLGHPQQDHETSHGSMSKTSWAIDGPDDTVVELKGRRFASNDDGAPMMCNLFCQDMGRHVHVDYCRATEEAPCDGAEVVHIHFPMTPNPDQPKDWISHSLFWKRSGTTQILSSGDNFLIENRSLGFKDPYSRDDQANFAKCEYMCPGPEHASTNPPAPSYCLLPILHPPQAPGQLYVIPADPNAQGYISSDGHSYACKNPAEMHPAYHVIFVIDKSSSMAGRDFQPLPNRPGADLIIRHSNNRLGAVFSSLHAFWVSRSSALNAGRRGASNSGGRRDAYSVIFFDHSATVCLQNDKDSTPEQLLRSLLAYTASGWTDSATALATAEIVMRDCWSDALAPVVIFLSDGECDDAQANVESISRAAVSLGKPLSFHSVIFGSRARGRGSLSNMAQFALDIQNANPNNTTVPSSFSEALNEVRLAETFLGFAESLRKPRGALLR